MLNTEIIIQIATVIVTLIFGIIAKKNPKYSNKLIPIQNIVVGLLIAIIEYIITKDFNVAIATSGLVAGGTYDLIHNLNKMIKEINITNKTK